MRLVPRGKWIAISAALVVLIGGGTCWFSSRQTAGPSQQAPADAQVARVQTVPIRLGTLTETLTAYGTTVAAPGASQVLSVPFESRVVRVLVANGERVRAGDTLLEIEPSPNTALQLQQAESAFAATSQTLKRVRERFNLKLATNEQLLTAGQAFEQAKLQLESLKKREVGGRRIRADVAGLVSQVQVQEGAIVLAGGPLLELVAGNRLEARLAVEPEDIQSVRPGQKVMVIYIGVSTLAPVAGSVREVSRSVTPATRLTNVFVTLPSSAHFLFGAYVEGKIPVTSERGLIVPRSAVLPSAGGYSMYTVENGHARSHHVSLGLESAAEAQVTAPDLRAGMHAVVLGNYELRDGMAVIEEPPR